MRRLLLAALRSLLMQAPASWQTWRTLPSWEPLQRDSTQVDHSLPKQIERHADFDCQRAGGSTQTCQGIGG